MNTQIRSFAEMATPAVWGDATPRSMPLRALSRAPELAWVAVLWILQGLLQVTALAISMPAGLALVLITLAKGGVEDLIQTHTSEKQS